MIWDTIEIAFANTLPWLFLARLVQGSADAVTWVVGLALIADLFEADERGRVMGLFMGGTTVGFSMRLPTAPQRTHPAEGSP